jgi:hypothetical protein
VPLHENVAVNESAQALGAATATKSAASIIHNDFRIFPLFSGRPYRRRAEAPEFVCDAYSVTLPVVSTTKALTSSTVLFAFKTHLLACSFTL